MAGQETAFAEVGINRAKELKTRLAVGCLLAVSCEFITGGWAPVFWLLLVCVGQSIDWRVFAPLRANPSIELTVAIRLACMGSVAGNAIIYTGIAAILWQGGGEAGRIFATLVICGALLHSTLHASRSKSLLLASTLPMCCFLIGLPIASWLNGQMAGTTSIVILVGGLVYLAHLIIIIRRSNQSTKELRTATLEAEAQKSHALSASQAKSDFLATVTHEIRTPMNAVMASAIFLRRTRLSKAQAGHVDMLNDAVQTLLALLNDVLDMSKIEAGKMTVESVDFPVIQELQAAVRIWDPRASDKGLALAFRAAPDLPMAIRADPLRIRQILFNLISNAVKFTEVGAIEVKLSSIESEDNQAFLMLEVADTGCGIDPETLGRLFGEFEQGSTMVARKKGGTGLGLAISRRLAELMGGSLSVESKVGVGTTFTVMLPYLPAQSEKEISEAKEIELASRPLRILVAEDHPTNQKIVSLFLSTMGWTLIMANDGQEALEAAAHEVFDAILMDMQMPVMDGLEATRQLRQKPGYTQTVPIIALTANAMDHHRIAFHEAGATAFVSKPIDPNTLIQTILMQTTASHSDTQLGAPYTEAHQPILPQAQ